MTQKELNEFSKKLEGKTLEELRKEEQDFIKVMDENDKKLSETKFKVPEDNFGIVGGFIAELLEKQEVQWQFATALVVITDFWKAKEKPAEIPFATLDSTMRILGEMKYKGYKEWTAIVAINKYMEPLSKEYVQATSQPFDDATKHDAIVKAIQAKEAMETPIGEAEQ